MLPDRLLIKSALIVIIFGLIGLYLASIFVEPKFVELKEISIKNAGEVVKTAGIISKCFLSEDSKTLFLDLSEDGKKLSIIMFNVDKNLFEKGDNVSVKGEVHIYKGKLEIVAKDIKEIK